LPAQRNDLFVDIHADDYLIRLNGSQTSGLRIKTSTTENTEFHRGDPHRGRATGRTTRQNTGYPQGTHRATIYLCGVPSCTSASSVVRSSAPSVSRARANAPLRSGRCPTSVLALCRREP